MWWLRSTAARWASMESPVSREKLGVVADDRSLAREGGYQSTTVVAAENQLQAAPEPSSDVSLGTAIGGIALVEGGQSGKVRRTLRLVSVQGFEYAVTSVAFGVHARHNTGEGLDSPGLAQFSITARNVPLLSTRTR